MRFLTAILLVIFVAINARAQSIPPLIGIEIATDCVYASGSETEIVLKIKCANFVDQKFLLYGF